MKEMTKHLKDIPLKKQMQPKILWIDGNIYSPENQIYVYNLKETFSIYKREDGKSNKKMADIKITFFIKNSNNLIFFRKFADSNR